MKTHASFSFVAAPFRGLPALGLAVLYGALHAAVPAEGKPPKPNIVHILVDDLGWQDVASFDVEGPPVYETPHLDRLARDGRKFTQAYAPAPTCAPSRAAYMVGKHPVNSGVYHVDGGRVPRPNRDDTPMIPPYYHYGLKKEAVTIPKVLAKAGYTTGHVGKWHIGGKSEGYPFPLDQGFDFGFSERRKGRAKYYNDEELWDPKDGNRNRFFGIWAKTKPDRLSDFATRDENDPYRLNEDGRPYDKPLDLALGFIKKHSHTPFFLNYCTFLVHGPICTRDRARLEHYCEKMGYDFPTDPGDLNAGKKGQMNPYYASMVDSTDYMIGQVVAFLETTDDPRNPGHKLIENTYVIISSDNGGWTGSWPQSPVTDNSPLYGGKLTTYEGGIRIPFLVRGPGVPAGTESSTPIILTDLFPTFMTIAGLAPDPALQLDGCDILPLMKNRSDEAVLSNGDTRDTLFWYYPCESHMSAVIREGGWKLIRNWGVGMRTSPGAQLFKLYNEDGSPNDLGEQHDLAEKHPERRDAMLAKLNRYLADAGTELPYRSPAVATPEERKALPAILGLGVEEDRIWVDFESGAGKNRIVDALLLYTLNPPPMDDTNGSRNEWFALPATLTQGRAEGVMPPGATHAVFCMRDSAGFQVTSEPIPSYQSTARKISDPMYLENGYAYRPGLFALIKLARSALASATEADLETAGLAKALADAEATAGPESATEEQYVAAIRGLRTSLRETEGLPEAAHPLLNRFPLDPNF